MAMWLTIFALTIFGTICGLIYLWLRFQKFGIVRRLAGGKRWKKRLLALVPFLIFGAFCLVDTVNAVVVLLHVMVFWILADIGALIVRKVAGRGQADNASVTGDTDNVGGAIPGVDVHGNGSAQAAVQVQVRPYWLGIGVLVFSALYLAAGWYLAHHVWVTSYDITTDKNLGQDSIRAVLFADSHIGTTFDGEGFAAQMKRVQAEDPDMVLIAGDYVDDRSNRKDMVRSCRALGELKTRYGVYYIQGNHDQGYFGARDFTYQELLAELEKNGVTVLEDQAADIGDSICIVGRKDSMAGDRKSAAELTKALSPEKYTIVLDHEPNDYAAEAEAGVDLVLSGHTHGGQLFPITYVGEWIGANDRTYGRETRGGTEFLVTSGISDWALDFKTGTKSEYVVLDIKNSD